MINKYQEPFLSDISFINPNASLNRIADFKILDTEDYNYFSFNTVKSEELYKKNLSSSLELYELPLFNPLIQFQDANLTNSKPVRVIKPQKKIEKNNIAKLIKSEAKSYEKKILKIINSDYYESGVVSNIEKFMETDCNSNNLPFIIEAAQYILRKNLTNEHIVEGILTLLSTKSYDEMEPQGTFMCLSLLSNTNYTIRDKAVQTYEKWNSKKGINDLLSVHCQEEWLQDYINKVIENLREYGND